MALATLYVLMSGSSRVPTPAVLGVTTYIDVTYTVGLQDNMELDISVPPGPARYPALLLIHGGGWWEGEKEGMRGRASDLAASGFVVFNVDYRLSPPGGPWIAPNAVNDVRAAVRWVRANGEAFGADTTRVGVFGESAGGLLGLMLGTTGENPLERVDAVAAWSAPTDLTLLTHPITAMRAANYVGCEQADCKDRWEEASPYYHLDGKDAPVFLANSTDEMIPLESATRFRDRMNQVGVVNKVLILEGSRHAGEYARDAWDETVQFLRTRLAHVP